MGRQQDGLCAAACFEHGCGLFHGGGVHPGERLVQQEGVTLGPEGAQEGGAPLLAAGELPGRQSEGFIVESKLYKVRSYLLFVLHFCLVLLCREHQRHIFLCGELGAEPVLLKDRADPAHPLHAAGSRHFQPHQDAQQGRLAPAAGCPEHRRAVHRQGQAFEEGFLSESFCQSLYFQSVMMFSHFYASSSPRTAATALSSRARKSFSNAALSRMMTKVHANSSPVERVIFAR